MNRRSNESLGWTSLLILFGVLALYGGPRWLAVLIPAAMLVWLVASIRRQGRHPAIDVRVDNRTGQSVSRR